MDTAIVSFLLLAIPTFFTPGPNNLMLMTSAAKFGIRRTLPHALGISLGFPAMVFLVGLGVGQLFVLYPDLKTILRFVSAAYFLWMAWNLLGIRIGDAEVTGRPMRMIEAALFQWVNPKAWAMATSFVGALMLAGEGRYVSLAWITFGCFALSPFSSGMWILFGERLAVLVKATNLNRLLGALLALLMVLAVVLLFL